jgi:Holliday junction resolvasome RuvABC endonuclease subunit
MQTILSFDISSTTIGYAVLQIDNNQIKFVSCNYLNPKKEGSIISRLVDTRDKIQTIINNVKPNYIGIEQIVEFMKGKSTAKTIIMLTSFNRMISLLAYDYLKTEPGIFSVMSIRHALKQNKIFPKKEEIPALVAAHLGVTFPWIYSKPRGKSPAKLIIENYDMADAVAVGLYYAFLLTNKIKKKVKK